MRWLLITVVAYACLVVETSVFRPGALAVQIDGHWVRPDLVLVLGLFLAFFFDPPEVFIAAWCLGLASDLVSVAGRLGLQALLFCVVLYLVSHLRGVLSRTRVLTQFLAAVATVFVVHLAWYMTTRLLGSGAPWVLRSVEESLLDALYAAVLAPYVFWALLWVRAPLGISSGSAPD
jgi:rod shape-determining protein MreD